MKQLRYPFLLVILGLTYATIGYAQPNAGLMFTSSSSEALATFREGLKFDDLAEGKKARQLFEKAIQQDPKLSIAYIYLAGHSASATEWADNLHKAKQTLSGTNEWEKLFYEYNETYLKDDLKKRLLTGQKMVAAFPTAARAYQLLGQAYSNLNDFKSARENYQKAISVEPAWPGGYRSFAASWLFEEPKDFSKGEEYANQLVNLAPTAAGYILLGDAYRAQNDLRKAEMTYAKAIELDKESPDAFYKRGHAYSFLGEYDKARTHFQQAGVLDIVPTYAGECIANTYLYDNKPVEAVNYLKKEITKAGSMKNAAQARSAKYSFLQDIAFIAFHTNNAELLKTTVAAIEPLSKEIGNSFNDADAKLLQESSLLYTKANAALVANDFAAATAKADEMKALLTPVNNPRKLEGYEELLGHAAYRQKDYKAAIEHFSKTDLLNVYNKYWLAKAYEGAGKKEKATGIYKELANYNFNYVGYALIRSEARMKM